METDISVFLVNANHKSRYMLIEKVIWLCYDKINMILKEGT